MKKLLMFAVFLFGSISLTTAQTGKKAKDTKKVAPTAKTEVIVAPSAERPKPAMKLPLAAASLVEANKATTQKKN